MDVKPLNFVIANKGRNMAAGRSRRTMVKIIDFGYVQFANSKRTRKGFIRTTQFRGTLEYTSPEMFRPAFFNRKKEAVYEVSFRLFYIVCNENCWTLIFENAPILQNKELC